MSTSVKAPYHHGDLRAALLSAAMDLLEEDGGSLSLRAVARRAGVSPAAPYRHFADKEALESELRGGGLRRPQAAAHRAGGSAGHPGGLRAARR